MCSKIRPTEKVRFFFIEEQDMFPLLSIGRTIWSTGRTFDMSAWFFATYRIRSPCPSHHRHCCVHPKSLHDRPSTGLRSPSLREYHCKFQFFNILKTSTLASLCKICPVPPNFEAFCRNWVNFTQRASFSSRTTHYLLSLITANCLLCRSESKAAVEASWKCRNTMTKSDEKHKFRENR